MGKTRDLFRKVGDTKGLFHANICTIKDRKGKDMTEAKDIKKRWQKCTGELYSKGLKDTNKNDVITYLVSHILECEVKWALGSITVNKASGCDGFQLLFQILKHDAIKVLNSICHQIWKTHQWPRDWKQSVFIPILKMSAKECSPTVQLSLLHMLAR